MVSPISSIKASQRLDSRGKPTVQVKIVTDRGTFISIVPSGASKGDYEAMELRDGDKSKYHRDGVLKAVYNVETVLGPAIIEAGLDPETQLKEIDRLMIKLDGPDDKSKMGANAMFGISMAAARAGAAKSGLPLYRFLAGEAGGKNQKLVLPVPFMNVLNGGDHSGNTMAFQEFMIAPVGAKSFNEAVRLNSETYACLKAIVISKHGKSAIGIGD
jgi:enolase